MRSAVVSLFPLFLLACGTDPVDEVDPPPPPPVPVVPDTTAPSVVSVTPADQATGVTADAKVVFVFSEAMDPESVANSLDARALGEVTLSWNTAADTLTVTPMVPLEYAKGAGVAPGLVQARSYLVILGTGGRDLAGNPVTAGKQTQFSTLKRMVAPFALDEELTGTANQFGSQFVGEDIFVGDDAAGHGYRGFLSYDISMLPLSAVEVESAVITARQMASVGDPYKMLSGPIQLEHITFDPIDETAFAAAPRALMGDFAAAGDEDIEVDVTAAVDDDRVHRLERGEVSQFRLRFAMGSDGVGEDDKAVIARAGSELVVQYLVP